MWTTEDEMVSVTKAINMDLDKHWELVKDKDSWCAVVHRGHKESDITK